MISTEASSVFVDNC